MKYYTVNFPGLGIENLKISPVAFQIGSFQVYWYGILIASAVLIGLFLAVKSCEKYFLTQDSILDCMLLSLPLAIIGARIYYVVFEWDMFKDNLWSVFDTRSGGLAFYGSVIGGILGILIISAVNKIDFSRFVDFLIVYLPLGQGIGRWGNFFNQEAFGSNTSLPWGMISDRTELYLRKLGDPGVNPLMPVHPTFLYEFAGNLIIFFILLRIRKESKYKYETFAWYLLLYGFLRFFTESVRTDSLYIKGTDIRVSMLLSGIMVICALAYLFFLRKVSKNEKRFAGFLKDRNLVLVRDNGKQVFVTAEEASLINADEISEATEKTSDLKSEAPMNEESEPSDLTKNQDSEVGERDKDHDETNHE